MRLVTCDGVVLCEDTDFMMEKGQPVLLIAPDNGAIVQLWDWSSPVGHHEKWVVEDGKLSPLCDVDQKVRCECSICHYRLPATPGDPCTLQGMKGSCKGVMNPVED